MRNLSRKLVLSYVSRMVRKSVEPLNYQFNFEIMGSSLLFLTEQSKKSFSIGCNLARCRNFDSKDENSVISISCGFIAKDKL